jgi:hypothetical protein
MILKDCGIRNTLVIAKRENDMGICWSFNGGYGHSGLRSLMEGVVSNASIQAGQLIAQQN